MRVLVYGMVGTNRGGIETFLLNMNEHMSDGCVFDYVIEEETCIHEDRVFQKGGKLFRIAPRKTHPMKNAIDSWRLMKSAAASNMPVYFNLSSLSWIVPVVEARLLKLDVFVHAHNSELIDCNSGFFYKLANSISRCIIKKMRIHRLTCSDLAASFMFGDEKNVLMIHNAIDLQKFRFNEEARNNIRKKLNIYNDIVVGFVGRIAYEKNPSFLLDIADSLSKQTEKNWTVVLLGDGPLRESFERQVRESNFKSHFLLLGNVPNPNDYMQAFDVLCLPSRHEGLPYVLVEAQASGLRCLVSDRITRVAAVTDLVSYLPVGQDSELWADAILKLEDRNRSVFLDTMSETRFNIDIEAPRLEGILRSSW
ncbi:glycosyltransferase [Paraeggerthella hongkongensis]|nr:glycosyltransferase [Paraeggerthella hongkongensis]